MHAHNMVGVQGVKEKKGEAQRAGHGGRGMEGEARRGKRQEQGGDGGREKGNSRDGRREER